MKRISRVFLFSALALAMLTAACTGQEGSPTPAGPTLPGDETASPPPIETDTAGAGTATPLTTMETTDTALPTMETATAAPDTTQTAVGGTTATPGIPVTGGDVILLECQYCIEGMAHALLVLPETATFEQVADTASLSTPGPETGCSTVDSFGGRQVVICRGEEDTSINLNICVNGADCTQLLVELQTCPDASLPGTTDTSEPSGATSTPGAGVPTSTPGAVTDTPAVSTPTATP